MLQVTSTRTVYRFYTISTLLEANGGKSRMRDDARTFGGRFSFYNRFN